jgi:hypothetical protein
MLKALAQKMTESPIGLAIGTDLFVGYTPSEQPNRCTTIIEMTGTDIDPYSLKHRAVLFQLISRASTYMEAREDAERIFESLIAVRGETWYEPDTNMSGYSGSGSHMWFVVGIEGIGPQYIGVDEIGRYEMSSMLTLRVRKES